MVKDKRIIVVVVVALLLVGGYFLSRKDSPEKQVRKQLAALCDCIDKSAGEPNTTLIIKNERMGRLLAAEIDVTGDAAILMGTHTATEFQRLIQHGRFMFQSVTFTFADVTITFSEPNTATVDCTVKLKVAGKGGQTQSQNMVRQLLITLTKIDGKWLFSEFNAVQVMEK